MAKALTAIGGFVGLLYYFDRLPNSMTETINVVVDSTKDNISIFLSKLLAMIPNLSSEKIITDSTEHSYNA